MKSFRLSVLHQRFPRVPLRLVLIMPFVLQTIGTVGLVAYFSYRSGQRTVEDLAYQLIDAVGDRINHQLEDYFEIPLQINQLNTHAVQLGQLDVRNESALEFRLWNQLMQFESLGTVMFLSPDGRFRAANRVGNPAGTIDISTANFANSLTVTSYQTDGMGRKQERLEVNAGIDLRRDRPWYRQAVALGKPGWSPASQFANTGLLVINAYHPVYQKQTHQLLGVFSVNVTLDRISQFLSSIDEMDAGEVFILEPDGSLIASSADPTPFTTQSRSNGLTSFTRLTPEQSQSALIREAHQSAQQKFGPSYWLRGRQRATLRLNGDRYFLQTFPFAYENGLNWQVVVLLPETRFMGRIDDNLRTTVLLSGGTLGLAIALGLLTFHLTVVTAVTSDITARKQTEALLATRERYLVALAQTQRHLLAAQNVPVDYGEILQGLGRVAGASRVMLFAGGCGGSQGHSYLQSAWCAEGVQPKTDPLRLNSLSLAEVFPRWAATLTQGGTVHGIATGLPEHERALLQAEGVLAVLLLPLVIHGQVEGFVMFINEAEARAWDLSEISFLGAAIAAIALYQERKQTEAALYESESTNHALIQSIPDLLIRMDRDGKYLNILNTGEIQLYKPENAQVGCGIYEILPFNHAQQRMHYTQLALQTGMMQSYEYGIDIDGRLHYEEARIIPCGEDTVLIIVRDMSERRLAEEQLRKTEQWLQQFSRQAPANIYTIVQEPDGFSWFEYISSAVEAMQEVTVEAVMADARVLLDKIHPEDRAEYLAAVTRSGETLEPFSHEWRTVMESGQVKWLQGRSQPERRSNGATAWYGVVIDVTEQKHTEQALQQALQEVETHFEDSPLAIMQWDQNCRVLRWSKQAEQIFGWTAAEVIGHTWQDISLVYQEDLERVSAEIAPLLQGQINNCAIQNRNYTKDGRVIDCDWYSSAVFDDAGTLVSVLSFAQDVTERKHTEEALRQSEQLFREAFATSAFGISVRSPQGRYLQVNQAFCKMLGYTEAELLQLDYRAITHPDDYAIDPYNTIDKLIAGEIPYYHLEKRFLHKDGSTVWGLVSISLVRDLQGQPLYFVALIHNITDRKQAEAALTQSEERFRSAFHSAPIGMALIGLNDRWLRVNSMLCRMLDYSEAELLSRPGSSLVHPEDVEKLNQCILQTLASPNRSAQAELRYLCRGGRIAWGMLSLSLVRDLQGQPLYCVAQIQDITERRAVDRMKKEFISIVSHELRTPLTAMQGALGLLITGIYDQRPDSAKRMIQIAYQNSDRLVRLVNDILDLERLESGKIELVKTVCDVKTLLQQAVEGVQAIADTAAVQMVIEPVSAQVWASSDAILQTLTNLLSNAIKFSPPHTVIHLSAHSQMESVLFEVRDQGRGIPEDKLNTIFEKFQQVDVSDSRQKGGTGLGLAICRNIIQQHGGEIWAESRVGSGSTFYFTLPIPDIVSG